MVPCVLWLFPEFTSPPTLSFASLFTEQGLEARRDSRNRDIRDRPEGREAALSAALQFAMVALLLHSPVIFLDVSLSGL